MEKKYDLVVIGGGFGGYSAAIRASQLGESVALVEVNELGGTCLNRGCIPAKTYLKSAEILRTAKASAEFGVNISGEIKFDMAQLFKRKNKITNDLKNGVAFLMKKNKVDVYQGRATVLGPSIFTPTAGSVLVQLNDSETEQVLIPKNLIIATGSRPKSLPNIEIDEEFILSSTGLLNLSVLPKSMVIIGGGVIGVEFASALNDFGVDITIVEYLDRLIPSENAQVAQQLLKSFNDRGIKTALGVAVETIEKSKNQVVVKAKDGTEFIAEKSLMAVGRQPNVTDLGLEVAEIAYTNKGITVNEYYQTNVENIYAIGDVIDTLQLAHVAVKEGLIAVEHMNHLSPQVLNYQNVPKCIYTYPEIASVGQVDATDMLKGKFAFQANGKAMIEGATSGQIQVFADQENDDLTGISMMGPHVTDMIGEGALALYLNATPKEIAETVHPHPSLVEALMEAAADVYHESINQ